MEEQAAEREMKKSPWVSIFVVLIVLSSSMSGSMADEQIEKSADSESAVHIVYVDRPENEEPEAFHIRTLASVVGSEEAAKEALIYHYKHAANGFSAKLTPKQVSDLSERPEVLQVTPSQVYQLHSGGQGGGGVRPSVM